MPDNRWQQIEELYHAALKRVPAARAAYLDEVCTGDEEVRRQVEALLAYDDSSDDFIEQPALEMAAQAFVEDPIILSQQLQTGQQLDSYQLLELLGRGGMGEVYLAFDTRLQRKVAIKLLPARFTADADRVRRFAQEARAASALNHPNILTIHEIGEMEDTHYIVTEYVEGETLRQRITDAPNKQVELTETLAIIAQIAEALVAAHEAGIIHRDIKPENVMVRKDGYVKILDFGLAKLIEPNAPGVGVPVPPPTISLTEAGVVMGTPRYMSPEQARGEKVDVRTDIFSLGVMLYEMVAGCTPFAGGTPSEVIAAILRDDPKPLAADVPEELQELVGKALSKDRAQRYQTTTEMLADLKRYKQQLLPAEKSGVPTVGASIFSPAMALAGKLRHWPSVLFALASIVLLVAVIIYFSFFGRSGQTIDSIAVMPFENVTHEQKIEYLSDGVTESLINSLSQLPHIKVIARSSVFSYKNQTPDLRQVARQLNVQAVLTGRVLMQGDTLDVRVELMDTQNNIHLWGEHYIRTAADIFAVQDEIARQVTDNLRVRLTGTQQEQVTKRYTENAEAYRLYLQGRYYLNEASEESMKRAVSFFDQAIALDPRYALAYAARAETFFAMGDISLPMSEATLKAKQNATMALSIDNKLVEARTILANIKFQYDWNFAGAEDDFKQVIALNPNYAEAHHQYAYYLVLTGKPMEGVTEMNLAQQLDPVNPSIVVDTMLPYNLARQYDQAIVQARKALEMFPNFFLPHMALGGALFEKGEFSAGIEELEKAKTLEPNPLVIGQLGYAYAKSGRKDEARKLLAEFKESSKGRYVPPFWIAMIYVGLGEKDEAFVWLEKAYQEREWWLVWLKMDSKLDSLRSDPRFADLLRRVGLPQ